MNPPPLPILTPPPKRKDSRHLDKSTDTLRPQTVLKSNAFSLGGGGVGIKVKIINNKKGVMLQPTQLVMSSFTQREKADGETE